MLVTTLNLQMSGAPWTTRKFRLKIIWLSLVLGLSLAQGCSEAQTLQLVTLQYPPYAYQETATSEVKGIAVDVLQHAFARLKQPVTICLYPWARPIKMIEDGEADAIFTAYKTPDRERFADYSDEVLMPQVVALFVLKESGIEFDGQLAKLADYQFGVVRKISYGQVFDQAIKDGQITKIDYATSGERNMLKLINGRFDILVGNKYGAWDILFQKNWQHRVRELQPAVENVPSYIAFSKKRHLTKIRDQLDQVLREMKSDGSYEVIVQRYFGRH